MKFPHTVRFRSQTATIYGKTDNYPFYRMAVRVAGKRVVRSFQTFGDAKREAEKKLREMAKGNVAAGLSSKEAADALAIRQAIEAYRRETGRKVSALEVVTSGLDCLRMLPPNMPLTDVVRAFSRTLANIKPKPLASAATEYIQHRKPLSVSKDGKRSKISPVYARHVESWLTEFADTFPGLAVCDLTKEHLDAYMGSFKDLSSKSRDDRRAVVKMFLREWCVPKDYLCHDHRLFEAVSFKTEGSDLGEIDFYRPKELRDLLDAAKENETGLVPVLVLGGLAGLRREEILRLEWADVWRVEGKVEISARIAKGRKRRLVSICPAVAAWLQPYLNATGAVWTKGTFELEDAMRDVRHKAKVPARRNGLRHSFITFHMAMHSNENLTAAEAGNSPQMIHDHYRALATKGEADKWFNIHPPKTA